MSAEPPNGRPRTGAARRKILDAAARRFYADGIAATGIDAITAQAGVAKMSLYNNFGSKKVLVASYLEARHEEWVGLYETRSASLTSPHDLVLAVFDAYIDHASLDYDRGFRGCGLLNAAAELPAGDPGRATVRRHKEQVEQIMRDQLLALTDTQRADQLAEHLAFLLEGAMSRAGLDGTTDRLVHARAFADDLLSVL